jgi:ATP-binding cassette subfamily B protein
MAASERLFQLLDTPTGPKEIENPVHLPKISGKIEFQNVWFTYDEGVTSDTLANLEYEPNWILRDISFTVEAGQTVAVVGPTGSGKTTLINLLLRFYEIQKGRILLDGVNIHDLPLDELRKSIGLVLQDVFLFSGSVYRNITLGNEVISDQMVHDSAQQIGADSFIERLSDGYNHDVKERGAGLSHGQRQLLSFARAVAYNPAVLVLDEATSSIDTESEELIQNALDKMFDGRSSIVIAHRLSTIQNADQILVVHKGVLREKGNHQELLNMNGLYRRLYELQYKEQEIDLD